MLPLIQKDITEKYGMMSEEEFLQYAALSQTLPGVIAVNCASFCGGHLLGKTGALVAVLGAMTPAFVIMLLVTMLVEIIPRTGLIEGVFKGIRAASAALIMGSAYTLGKREFKRLFPVLTALVTFSLILFVKFDAFPVVIAAGVAGIAYEYAKGKRQK